MVPEFCKRCGSSEFYVRGKYFRCVPCTRSAAKRYHQKKKLDQKFERKDVVQPKSIKKLLREPKKYPPHIIAHREKEFCPQGHPYNSPEVTRISGQGKYRDVPNRHCRICNKNAQRRRYGIEEDHSFKPSRGIADFLLDTLDDDV